MKHELETFRRETLAIFDDIERLLIDLSDDDVNRKPSPTEWSAGECLDHLTITARAYRQTLDAHIERGGPLGSREYRPSWIWRKFVASLEPPVKRKFKAPAPFVPSTARRKEQIATDFMVSHQEILAVLPSIERLDTRRIRISSPFASWVRYPLGLVFYILPAHCRRHLWQAREALARTKPLDGKALGKSAI